MSYSPLIADDSSLQPERELTAVWDAHPDEAYRRDVSHWRGEGRWKEGRWLELGQTTSARVSDLFDMVRRPMAAIHDAVVLEWGPGGGANVFALAGWAELIYGVDVSPTNLAECERVAAERNGEVFRPIVLRGEPATIVADIRRPVDLFISTAVFQHFPTKAYGREVLETVRDVLGPRGLGYVQIRYDDGDPRYKPKHLSDYRAAHITAMSYGLAEFWNLLTETGFTPLKIADLNTRVNYASFYFSAATRG